MVEGSWRVWAVAVVRFAARSTEGGLMADTDQPTPTTPDEMGPWLLTRPSLAHADADTRMGQCRFTIEHLLARIAELEREKVRFVATIVAPVLERAEKAERERDALVADNLRMGMERDEARTRADELHQFVPWRHMAPPIEVNERHPWES